VAGIRQDPTKTTTIYDSVVALRTVIRNRNRLFYLESTAASCLHVRKLCPVSPQRLQRLQRLCARLLALLLALLFLLLRAADSIRVINCRPSLAVRVLPYYIRFLLRDFRRVAALLAALSLATRFCDNTSLCVIRAAPFTSFLNALTIKVRELSKYL
jgi:hypothetical protein